VQENMSKAKVVYDESTIKTLDALSHIRLRTGMYVGRLGDGSHPQDGIYVLLKEVVDNSIDEFIMGAGKSSIWRGNRTFLRSGTTDGVFLWARWLTASAKSTPGASIRTTSFSSRWG